MSIWIKGCITMGFFSSNLQQIGGYCSPPALFLKQLEQFCSPKLFGEKSYMLDQNSK